MQPDWLRDTTDARKAYMRSEKKFRLIYAHQWMQAERRKQIAELALEQIFHWQLTPEKVEILQITRKKSLQYYS